MNLKERIEQIVEEKVAAILDQDINSIQGVVLGDPPAASPQEIQKPPEPESVTARTFTINEDGSKTYIDSPNEKKLTGYIVELLEENMYLYNAAHGYVERLRKLGYKPKERYKRKRRAFSRIKEDLNL